MLLIITAIELGEELPGTARMLLDTLSLYLVKQLIIDNYESPEWQKNVSQVTSDATRQRSRISDVEKGKGDEVSATAIVIDDDRKDDTNDCNIVWWDGPDDPENPYNWPSWRKWTNCGLISIMTFLTPLASSMFAPSVPQVMAEFESKSLEIASFVVSVYILGFAAGPLLFAPLSEIYGRIPIYHVSNFAFVAFTVGCALAPNLSALIVFRFFCGVCGSTSITIGGGSIADMIVQERRGAVLAGFSVGPLLGPIIGPIAGGFLAGAKGWRWVFWVLAIVIGFFGLCMVALMKESYASTLMARRAARLRKETGNDLLQSKLDMGLSPPDFFKRGIVRPIKMLIFSPIIDITASYLAINYGLLYLFFTTFTSVFGQTYGFSTSIVGLSFVGLGIGSIIGLVIFSTTSDNYMKKKAAEAATATDVGGGDAKPVMIPEYRLPYLPSASILVPVGLLIYGWTAYYHVHWVVPIIGTSITGIGIQIVYMSLSLYLIDAFATYAASALAAGAVVRSIVGAVLPLAGLPLYRALGLGWGNTLLAFIALALVPVAVLFLRYSQSLRNRFEIKDL
ncbi:MFS general substrate transporter [Nemania serpens]|nr:MFS general substrate transporter [Nemania serpens]